MLIKEKELKKFFNLSYGEKAPSREEWESLYNKQVKFIKKNIIIFIKFIGLILALTTIILIKNLL